MAEREREREREIMIMIMIIIIAIIKIIISTIHKKINTYQYPTSSFLCWRRKRKRSKRKEEEEEEEENGEEELTVLDAKHTRTCKKTTHDFSTIPPAECVSVSPLIVLPSQHSFT